MKKYLIIAVLFVGMIFLGQSVKDTTVKKKPMTKEQQYEALRKDLKEQKVQMKQLNKNDTIK